MIKVLEIMIITTIIISNFVYTLSITVIIEDQIVYRLDDLFNAMSIIRQP